MPAGHREGKINVGLDPGLRRLALGTLLAAYPGPVPPDWAVDLVAEGLAGHTLFGTNVHNPAQVAASTAALRVGRADVLIAIDEEGGDVTRLAHATGSPYPGNAALGAIGDVALTRRVYQAIGAELAALGITVNLAPTVDVNTADDNPVIGTRSFGADPVRVAAHSAAAVTGSAGCRRRRLRQALPRPRRDGHRLAPRTAHRGRSAEPAAPSATCRRSPRSSRPGRGR